MIATALRFLIKKWDEAQERWDQEARAEIHEKMLAKRRKDH